MTVTALLHFLQGAIVGANGQALKVVAGQPVTIGNSDNTGIRSWQITLLHKEPGSAVPVGVVAFSNDGSVPSGVLTPDVAGSYRVMLDVWDQPGRPGTPTDTDIRVFAVPLPNGTILPPSQLWPEPFPDPASGLPNAKPHEMNFGGQPDGWSGNGVDDGLLNAVLRKVDGLTNGGGGGGDSGVPLSAVMYVDGGTAVAMGDQTGGIGAPFSTIAAAHNTLPPGGGTILVVGGIYPEALSFTKPIKLEAIGPIHGGGSFNDSTVDGVTVLSLTSTTILGVKGVRSFNGSDSIIHAGGTLTGEQSSGIFQGVDVYLNDCVHTGGTLTCQTLKAHRSLFLGDITASGTVIELNDCRFKDSGSQTITFSGSAGTLYVDDVTKYYWQIPTESLVNGTLVLLSTISGAASIPTDTLVGRDSAGTGAYENISVGGGIEFTGSLSIQRSALTGDVTASAGSNSTTISNNAVTFSKLADISSGTLIGRDAAGTGDPGEITLGGGLEFTGLGSLRRSALTGDVTASAGSNATVISNDAVTDAKLRNSAGTSVIGRAAGTTGDPADIAATADGQVLVRTSGSLGFSLISTASITDGSVTLPKIQNIPTDSLIGRDTAGSGPPESITLGVGLEFTGSQTIQRSALTGDVTASAGSNVTTIANNAVTFAKMQDIATDTLIGRDTAGTGDPQSITVTGGLEFTGSGGIQRSALTGDVTAPAGSNTTTIANGAVTLAKMANMNTDRLLGRDTAGIGSPEEISVGGGLEFTGSGGIQRSALTGDVTSPAGSNVLTIVGGSTTFSLSGSITPPQITADQNNYSPTGLSGASFIRLSSDANRTITGLTGGSSGRLIYLMNVGSNLITFSDSNTGSTTTNRFLFGADLVLAPNNGLLIEYDATDSRWRKVNISITVAGGLDVVTGGLERSALTGDVTAAAGSNVTTISATAVTFAKMQNIPTDTLIGRDTAGTGSPESLTVSGGLEFTGSGGIQRSALTGDVTAPAGSNATTIANNVVTDAKLRTGGANTVIGRASATTGNVADIAAGTDTVLGRNGSNNLAFTQVQTTMIADGAVTLAKSQTIATDTLLGRDSIGTGVIEQLTVSGGLEFTGTGGIQRSALTGDVTASAGSNTTQIALNAVANGKLADMANGTIKGRISAGTGDPEDLTGTQVTTLLDLFSATLKGLVPASGGGTTNFLRADGTFAIPAGTTVPGGSTGQIQYNNGGVFAGATNVKTDGTYVSVGASASLPTQGAIRLVPSAGSGGIWFRNNILNADISGLFSGTDDVLYLGDSTNSAGVNLRSKATGVLNAYFGANATLGVQQSSLSFSPVAATSGTAPVAFTVTGAAHTGLTASTEPRDVTFALNRTVTMGTGALTNARAVRFQGPTYAFAGASTISVAATVAIGGAPAAGTNATITNSLALWVEGGAAGFGASPAQSGVERFSTNTFQKWRSNVTAADLNGIGFDATDSLVLGDNTNGVAVFLDCATAGTIHLRAGANVFDFTSSALTTNNKNIVVGTGFVSAGSSPAQSGQFRGGANTLIVAGRGSIAGYDVPVASVDGSDHLVIGGSGTNSPTTNYYNTRTSGQHIFQVNATDVASISSSFLDLKSLVVLFGTGSPTNAKINLPNNAGATMAAMSVGGVNPIQIIGGVDTSDVIRFGDASYAAKMFFDIKSGGDYGLYIGGSLAYDFFPTYAAWGSNQLRFGANPSTNALIDVSYSASSTSIMSTKDSGGTDRNLIVFTSLNHAQFGSGLISTDIIAQGNTWAFGSTAAFPGVDHFLAAGATLKFGAAPSANATINFSAANTILLGAKNLSSTDRALLTWGNTDALTLGSSSLTVLVTASGGNWTFANTATFPGVEHNLATGGFLSFTNTRASQGTIRGSTSFSIYALTTTPADMRVVSVASSILSIGDSASASSVWASGGTISLRPTGAGSDAYAFDTTTADFKTHNLKIDNTGSVPSPPASGGVLYVVGGAPWWVSSTGTRTELAPA